MRALLDAGADIEKSNTHGTRPIHMAADSDQAEIVQCLLEAWPDGWLAQLPSGNLCCFFGEGFPFKVNQPKRDAFFSHGHWASELTFFTCLLVCVPPLSLSMFATKLRTMSGQGSWC